MIRESSDNPPPARGIGASASANGLSAVPKPDALVQAQAESDAITARLGEIIADCEQGHGTAEDADEWRDLSARSLTVGARVEQLHGEWHRAYSRHELADGTRSAGEPGEA